MWQMQLMEHPKFRHRPYSERRKAACQAQGLAMRRHWQCWLAMLASPLLVAALSGLGIKSDLDPSGFVGGLSGFVIGLFILHPVMLKFATPYYCEQMDANDRRGSDEASRPE